MTPASFGLLGSGEFEPWTEPVDRWLLERATGDGSVLILPAASAPEGDHVFDMWADMGLTHYGRLGIQAEVVPIKTREDADQPEYAELLARVSMAFFSGGNPSYLTAVLQGSSFWTALLRAMDQGLAYAGCSAGMACLGDMAADSSIRDPSNSHFWKPALRLFPKVWLGPHWDALDTFMPGLRDFIVRSVPPDCRLLAIDERTAIVGDGTNWTVVGSGCAHLLDGGAWIDVRAQHSFLAPLVPVGEASSS